MSIAYNKARVHIHLDAIVANFRRLASVAKRPMPIIKSDAYGHGIVEVGLALEAEGAKECGVGTIEEGVFLRKAGFQGRIISLLGALDDSDAMACIQHHIIPMVFDKAGLHRMADAQQKAAAQSETQEPALIGLKFNTGMARLGFFEDDIPSLCAKLRQLPMLEPYLALSHFAVADDPKQIEATQEQGAIFARVMHALREHYPQILGSLANTAATLAHPEFHWDIQRPGIALYGFNPMRGTAMEAYGEGFIPAMSVEVPVIQVHMLKKGSSASYGHTFTAEHDMTIAVIAAGYADTFSRGLSNQGSIVIQGQRAPILGRICMQMCMVDVSHITGIRAGDAAWLMGGPQGEQKNGAYITADELADTWGTISYEVLCLLGMSPRHYD